MPSAIGIYWRSRIRLAYDSRMTQQGLLPEIEARHSCRSYLPDPISREAIQRILDAGALAPSGANQQPWHMVVIDEPELKMATREACEAADRTFHQHISDEIRQWMQDHEITTEKPFLTEAPVLIAVFYDPKAPYPLHSAWIAISFMLLQATREGLGTLTYTPSAADVKDLLGVPKKLQLAAILPLGKPRELRQQPRKPGSETQSWNLFGEQVKSLG